MKVEAIIAGHGGQGVLELANYISYFQLLKGRHVAYTPSYGPETRGGKVKCYVVGSDDLIDSPIVEEPDFLIVMNIPSMDFVPLLKKGGTLVANSSLVTMPPDRGDIRSVMVPATEIAAGLKEFGPPGGIDTVIVANSVMFGAYLALTEGALEGYLETVRHVYEHFLTERKAAYVPLNLKAVQCGYEQVTNPGGINRPAGEVPAV